MQSVRSPQAEMRAKPCGVQVDRIGHRQKRKLVEQLAVGALQHGVASLHWSDQAFAFDQRRDAETRRLGSGDGAGYALTLARVVFNEIDDETGIEIDQFHAFRSSSMAASISSAVRRA
jgi:hypothetical protein